MSSIIQLSLFNDKRCSRCGLMKDRNEFANCRKRSDGKASYCKPCQSAYSKAHYIANKDRIDAHNKANYFKDIEKSRQWHRDHYYQNRERYLASFAEYRKEKRDYFRKYNHAYYKLNKHHLNAQSRAAYARDKAERKIKSHQWRRANRAKCNELWQRRRARLKSVGGKHTASEWLALRVWFGDVCLCCGLHVDLTADHVIPVIKGGSNGIENLQPLCRSCNSIKHDKTIDYRDPVQLVAFLASLPR